MSYDPVAAATFYDEYGEREWTRFEDGRTPGTSARTHTHYLRRFVRPDDRVLDVGCGPGRFTIELARIGARIVATDISPGQLDLHRRFVSDAGLDEAVESRVVADVADLPFADDDFDVVVCYGGAVSYVLDDASRAIAELFRVTRPGGIVLLSVMSLVGASIAGLEGILSTASEHGDEAVAEVIRTGDLPSAFSNGHLPMRMYRSRELAALLEVHGELEAICATGLFHHVDEGADLVARLELELGAEPGAVDAGRHILAVTRK